MKKKILILFLDYHLPYSPTTLGLYDELSKQFDVEIVTLELSNPVKIIDRNVKYIIPIPSIFNWLGWKLYNQLSKILSKAKFSATYNLSYKKYLEYINIKNYIKKSNYYHIIAVDFFASTIAQKFNKKYTFLSLEISDTQLLNNLKLEKIDSVITQSKERYEYLFQDKNINTFFIQNSPVYKEIEKPATSKNKLVFSGHASKGFGAYSCLHFINKYREYELTFHGNSESGFKDNIVMFYPHLLEEKRIIFNDNYLSDNEIETYLSGFRIGFCFYDYRFEYINNINYFTAPSGKLFKYYLSGIPVIGIDIPGLASVKEFETGILITDFNADSIKSALDIIENNYEKYVKNCFIAAKHFDFAKNAKPFSDHISTL